MSCPHCHGFGFDASGLTCTCQQTKVARVGKRMHAKDPLPLSGARAYMRHLARALLLTLALLLTSAVVVGVLP